MEILYIYQKQDLELIVAQIAKFRFKMKKVRKSTRPFMIMLVEVMNWFKGLDMLDRVLEEVWTEVHNIVENAVAKTTLK